MTTILLRGGRVYTPAHPAATAMLVSDDTIAWVGTDAESPGADQTIELAGALVAPAFVDAHVHITSTGLALTGLHLAGVPSLAAALDRVAAYARTGTTAVILGSGWDETTWPEGRPPTAAELDRAAAGAPVYLSRVDAHSGVVSTALLAAHPEVAQSPGYDPGGHVRVEANEVLRAAAYAAISADQATAARRAARRRAASLGIGCLHEMATPSPTGTLDVEAVLDLAAAEPGPDVIAYWGELGGVDTVRRLGLAGAGGDLFADGSIGSHTAALVEPYTDRPDTSGRLRFDADQIAEHVLACTRAGAQAGFHAIGDRALDTVLTGMERAAARVDRAAFTACRHRIEHAEMPPDPDRFAALGLAVSAQPAFDAAWGGTDGMYARRLGARAAGLNPFAAYRAAGVHLAFGSDSPVTPLDPWGGVRAAVRHRTGGSGVPVDAAFTAATRGGWWAARRDADGAGTLVPGAPATYAVWEVWPYDETGLPDLSAGTPACLRTVVRGRTAFVAG